MTRRGSMTKLQRTTDGRIHPRHRRRCVAASIVLVAAALAACTSEGTEDGGSAAPAPTAGTPTSSTGPRAPIEIPPVDGPYDWKVDAANFVEGVHNPYFPLPPGTTLVYEGKSDGDREVVTIKVMRRTKEILGVRCVVVKDTVEVNGELAEFTLDWYAQDVDGNVWYFGERTAEYEHGEVTTRAGSWEAGVDGALPGVIMPADPAIGLAYTQEHYAGEAEDKGRIVALGQQVTVPAGSFEDVLVTEDWTPLEPKVLERKSYAPGVGVVFEELVKGGSEALELVEMRRT
jgi:hypothetical protein